MARRLTGVALLSFACTLALWLRTDHLTPVRPEFALPWDHHMYLWMAQHGPLSFHVAPYCWRVLGPAVVWASPLGVQAGFEILTFVAIWLTGVAVYALCERLGFRSLMSIAGTLLYFTLGYATKWLLFDFWLSDPLAILLVVLAVLFAHRGRTVAFALTLVAGVLAKESAIFAAPLLYTLQARRRWDPRLASRTLAAALPAIAVLVALHLGIHEMNRDPAYVRGLPRLIRENTIHRYTYGAVLHDIVLRRSHSIGRTLVGAVGAFGVLVPALSLLGLRRRAARSFALRVLPFIVLVYVQLLFAYNTERLLVIALPALVPLAVWGLVELVELVPRVRWIEVALPATFFVAQLAGTHQWEPILPVQAALAAGFGAVLGTWSRTRRPGRAGAP